MDETAKRLLENDINKHVYGEITITYKTFYRGELIQTRVSSPIQMTPHSSVTIKYNGLDAHVD